MAYLLAMPTFASPEIYEDSKPRDGLCVMPRQAKRFSSGTLRHAPSVARKTRSPFPRQLQLSGPWNKKRRVVAKVEWHPGELSSVGFIVTNLSRNTKRWWRSIITVARPAHFVKNAINWTRLSCRKFRNNAVRSSFRPGLQSGQLHEDTGFAEGGGALVDDDVARQAGEDRGQGCPTWPLRYVPIG